MFSPKLQSLVRVRPSIKSLIGLPLNVEYLAMSAEGKTAQGISPVLAILDEVGQVIGPNDEFISAVTTAQGAHDNPLLIVISTQAANDTDLLSIWIDDAKASGDPRIVCHVYEAPKDCELNDETAWGAANPALGIFRSFQDVKDQAEEAMRMPSAENTFRNLILNQRVSLVSPFISKSVWESCGLAPLPLDPAYPVWGGLDLSARTDLTALVLTQEIDDVWQVHAYFWTPEKGLEARAKKDKQPYAVWVRSGHLRTTPGATVDYEYIAKEMGEILEPFTVNGIGFDRWRIDLIKKELEEFGIDLPMLEFGQGYKDMSPALDTVESDLLNARFAHGMHPVLTMCAANAVISQDPARNRKLDKHKATGRIDGMVALTMARGVSAKAEDQTSIYETQGLISL